MSKRYEPQNIEKKWQKIWQDEKAFAATDDYTKPKYYALVEFPYPSGQGLHVGHPRPYTALDIVARKRRMQGYNVLYPMGWDAFGLPTENYAIKNHIHPKIVTKNNVHHFKDQLQSLGYSFDWDREINTTDPEYYHWTQWIFLKLFKAGLAYKKEMPINWCTSCKVGLANEEVVNGVCERCGSPVVRKVKSEWMLKITEYADKLIDGLDGVDPVSVDWNELFVSMQQKLIDGEEGAICNFEDYSFYEVQPYFAMTDHVFSTDMAIASQEWLESLSEEDRALVDEAIQAAYEYHRDNYIPENEALLEKFASEYGTQITYPDDAMKQQMKEAMQPVTSEMIIELVGQETYDEYMSLVDNARPAAQ